MKKFSFLFFIVSICVVNFNILHAQSVEPVVTQEVVATPTENVVSNVSELAPKANELSDKYSKLADSKLVYENFLNNAKNSLKIDKEKFSNFKVSYEDLINSKYTGYDKVSEIGAQIRLLSEQVDKNITTYTSEMTELSNVKKEWELSKANWQKWRSDFYKEFYVVKDIFNEANKNINLALADIATIEKPFLTVQSELVAFQSDIKILLRQIDTVLANYKKDIFTKTNVSFFTESFWNDFDVVLFKELLSSLTLLNFSLKDISTKEVSLLLCHLSLAIIMMVGLLKLKKKNSERENLKKLSSRAIATSLFVSTVIVAPYYGAEISTFFKVVLLFIASISGARLVSGFIFNKSVKVFVDILVIAFLISKLFVLINIPEPIIRIYVAIMALFIFLVLMHKNIKYENKNFWKNFITISMKILLVIIFFSQIFGYSQFSLQIFDSSIRSIFSGILAWLLGTLVKEFFYVMMTYSIFSKIRFCENFSADILKRLNILTDIGIYFLTFCVVLVAWGCFVDVNQAMNFLLNLGITTDSITLTIGGVALAVFLFYFILTISWILKKALEDTVYLRKNVQLGVQTSINRIIQYVFVFIGALISLSILGLEFKNLAVIFGVLGVGIGFGLQNIVNNFASGLILLFERPIKVGDVIDVNGQKGEVKKLGLRATIVETYDKSEVIVPNSNIASSQVVNWTLSNRKIRTVFPIGVSYDSDVEQVKALLLDIAKNQEGVLKNPEPGVTFVSFGESSLDFELRVWSKIDDGLMIKDGINTKIYNVFKKENIEIPFPKRDVNLIGLEKIVKKIIDKKG